MTPPLTWTTEKPTEAGWYWVKDYEWITDKSYSIQARVVWVGPTMIKDDIIKRDCSWAGPIPEPIDDNVEHEPVEEYLQRETEKNFAKVKK